MTDTSDQTPQPPIRADLVERVRREIAAGVYETPEKLEIALARLVDSVRANSAGGAQ